MAIPDKEAAQLDELTSMLKTFDWKNDLIETAKQLISSQNREQMCRGVTKLKGILCIAREQVFSIAEEVINSGVVPYLIQFIQIEDEELQLSAAFCLTNVAAGSDEQTDFLVKLGAIKPLMHLLTSKNDNIRRQALFCLANIAGSTPEHRQLLLSHNEYYPGIFASTQTGDSKILEIVAWNLRNLSVLPGPSFEARIPAFKWFSERFASNRMYPILARHSIESLFACAKSNEGLQLVSSNRDLIVCLVETALSYPNSNTVRNVALDILQIHILHGDSERASDFIEMQGLRVCSVILDDRSNSVNLRRTAAHILAHISSGDRQVIQGFRCSGHAIFKTLLSVSGQLEGPEDPDVREQASIALARNIVCNADDLLENTVLKCILEAVEFEVARLHFREISSFPLSILSDSPQQHVESSALFIMLRALCCLLEVGAQLASLENAGENPVKQSVVFLDGNMLLRKVMENCQTLCPSSALLARDLLAQHFQ